jgi:hypothetical protein
VNAPWRRTWSAAREKINDPNIKGPFETGWGYNGDFTQPPTANLLIELPVPDDIQ